MATGGTNDKWHFYQSAETADYRWKRVAPNGETVGASTEGYERKADCVANARRNGFTGPEPVFQDL